MYHTLCDSGSGNLNKISSLDLIFVKGHLIDQLLIVVIEMQRPHMLIVQGAQFLFDSHDGSLFVYPKGDCVLVEG